MDSNGKSQPLMDVVLQFFQEDHWNYQKIEQKPVVRAGYRGERGTWVCFARVDENHQRFILHALLGMNIPGEYRPAVSEFLMRVNQELPVGNFEMNMDSGEIRFKTSVETPGGELSVVMVRAMAYTSLHAMDYYFPGVLAVVHGGLSPESALKRVAAQALENG